MALTGGSSGMSGSNLTNDDEALTALESLFEPPTDAVCSFGDIILVADTKHHPIRRIQVSSCILSMVSPVFRALFSKKFAEGQLDSKNGPKEIRLDEDPRAVRVLCRLLHHRPPEDDDEDDLYAEDLSIDLLSLAILADKYDCVGALRMPVKGLFDKVNRYFADFDGVCDTSHFDLAVAAYIFDQPEIFRDITKALVLHSSSITPQSFSSRCQDFLPPMLASTLSAQLQAVRNEFTHHVGALFQAFCTSASTLRCQELIVDFVNRLKEQELLPINYNNKSHTLFRLLEHLELVQVPVLCPDAVYCHCSTLAKTNFKTPDLQNQNDSGWLQDPEWDWKSINSERPGWRRSCLQSPSRIRNLGLVVETLDLLAAGKNVRSCIVGVCADCLHQGRGGAPGEVEDMTECRVLHPRPWLEPIGWRGAELNVNCFAVSLEESDSWGGSLEFTKTRPEWWQVCW